jgi:methylated-DNA-protein-cysteine methyltransferase related protein
MLRARRQVTRATAERRNGLFARIYTVVRRVPRGRVASYGLIARLVGPACGARTVGYALAATPDGSNLPWQRIVNREGRISLPGAAGAVQRARLEAEGVTFDARGRIDMARFGWSGLGKRRPAARLRNGARSY